MAKSNLAVIVGSNRRDSINRKLAHALAKLGAGSFDANFPRIDDLPMFNQDLEGNLPAEVVRYKNELARADAVLIVTPEHDRSIRGVAEERRRLGRPPLWQELVGRQARLHHRHLARRDRQRAGAAASALDHGRAWCNTPRRRSLRHFQAGPESTRRATSPTKARGSFCKVLSIGSRPWCDA